MTQDTTALAIGDFDDLLLPDDLPPIQLDPPRLNWHHGVKAAKTPGVFFGREGAFAEPPPAPWQPDERFIDTDGLGYSIARLRLAFIGERSQWFIPGETDDDPAVWLMDGQRQPDGAKVKKHIEYLVLVDGMPDVMVLAVSGYYKSRPIEQILRAYERGALAQQIRRSRRQLPRWTHWLTIGCKVDAQGKPIIEKATDAQGKEYGSDVTPPTLLAAPELVSRETFQQAIDAWNLYNSLGWFKFKRMPRDVVEGQVVIDDRPALPAPKNKPQAYDPEVDQL